MKGRLSLSAESVGKCKQVTGKLALQGRKPGRAEDQSICAESSRRPAGTRACLLPELSGACCVNASSLGILGLSLFLLRKGLSSWASLSGSPLIN